MIICLLHILCMTGFPVNAQEASLPSDYLKHYSDSIQTTLKTISIERGNNGRNENLYLDPEWRAGIILTKRNEILPFSGRYSVLDNAVEAKVEGVRRIVMYHQVHSIRIADKIFVPVRVRNDDGFEIPTFFELLSSGKLSLFIHHKLKSRMKGSNPLTSSFNGEREYFVGQDYYYSINQEEFVKFKPSRKKLVRLMSDKRQQVEAFVRRTSLKFRTRQEYVQLVDYYNSMIQG